MKDLFLLLRVFVLTVLAILALQIKVGDQTLERKSEAWLRSSSFVGYVQEIADGAMVVVDRALNAIDSSLEPQDENTTLADEQAPGRRHMAMRLERSKAFIKEKAKQAKAAVKKGLDKVQDEYLDDQEVSEEIVEETVDDITDEIEE